MRPSVPFSGGHVKRMTSTSLREVRLLQNWGDALLI
jgi:hypothetical protein